MAVVVFMFKSFEVKYTLYDTSNWIRDQLYATHQMTQYSKSEHAIMKIRVPKLKVQNTMTELRVPLSLQSGVFSVSVACSASHMLWVAILHWNYTDRLLFWLGVASSTSNKPNLFWIFGVCAKRWPFLKHFPEPRMKIYVYSNMHVGFLSWISHLVTSLGVLVDLWVSQFLYWVIIEVWVSGLWGQKSWSNLLNMYWFCGVSTFHIG